MKKLLLKFMFSEIELQTISISLIDFRTKIKLLARNKKGKDFTEPLNNVENLITSFYDANWH